MDRENQSQQVQSDSPGRETDRSRVSQKRAEAEKRLQYRLAERTNAIEDVTRRWDKVVADARSELRAALDAEKGLLDELSDWITHDGGDCPISRDAPVHFRTKMEWRAMLAGEPMSITEDHCRYASTLRWRWEAKDHDDIAAYKLATRDRDGAEGGDANAAPVPQDRQARAEGIARPWYHDERPHHA